MDRKEKEKRETPIIDGDARPDMPVDSDAVREEQKKRKTVPDDKFESERKGDVNSLEDYKDAK